MAEAHFYIRNMVCERCIRVVREELGRIGLSVKQVSLGEAVVTSDKPIEKSPVAEVLAKAGFELLEDKNIQLIEKIKTLIIEAVHRDKEIKGNFSEYIAREIGKDYHHLSTLFSSVENITIEKFIILQKIEKVKELLIYDELNLSEIAYRLRYSSVAHLSAQFKQVTGLTPSAFKKLRHKDRKPLDKIN